nr:hypothetical protein [Rhizobium leguminosarum]
MAQLLTIAPGKIGGPFGDQPFAVATDIFIMVGDAAGVLDLLSGFIRNEDHQAIGCSSRGIPIQLDRLLTVDVIDGLEVGEVASKGIANLLAALEG